MFLCALLQNEEHRVELVNRFGFLTAKTFRETTSRDTTLSPSCGSITPVANSLFFPSKPSHTLRRRLATFCTTSASRHEALFNLFRCAQDCPKRFEDNYFVDADTGTNVFIPAVIDEGAAKAIQHRLQLHPQVKKWEKELARRFEGGGEMAARTTVKFFFHCLLRGSPYFDVEEIINAECTHVARHSSIINWLLPTLSFWAVLDTNYFDTHEWRRKQSKRCTSSVDTFLAPQCEDCGTCLEELLRMVRTVVSVLTAEVTESLDRLPSRFDPLVLTKEELGVVEKQMGERELEPIQLASSDYLLGRVMITANVVVTSGMMKRVCSCTKKEGARCTNSAFFTILDCSLALEQEAVAAVIEELVPLQGTLKEDLVRTILQRCGLVDLPKFYEDLFATELDATVDRSPWAVCALIFTLRKVKAPPPPPRISRRSFDDSLVRYQLQPMNPFYRPPKGCPSHVTAVFDANTSDNAREQTKSGDKAHGNKPKSMAECRNAETSREAYLSTKDPSLEEIMLLRLARQTAQAAEALDTVVHYGLPMKRSVSGNTVAKQQLLDPAGFVSSIATALNSSEAFHNLMKAEEVRAIAQSRRRGVEDLRPLAPNGLHPSREKYARSLSQVKCDWNEKLLLSARSHKYRTGQRIADLRANGRGSTNVTLDVDPHDIVATVSARLAQSRRERQEKEEAAGVFQGVELTHIPRPPPPAEEEPWREAVAKARALSARERSTGVKHMTPLQLLHIIQNA